MLVAVVAECGPVAERLVLAVMVAVARAIRQAMAQQEPQILAVAVADLAIIHLHLQAAMAVLE
jgi:hypothetical protein